MSEAGGLAVERARQLHREAIVIDGLQIDDWGPEIFEEMRKGGLTAVNCTCCVWEGFRETIDNIASFKAWCRASDGLCQIFTVGDIRHAAQNGQVGIILGFQNTSALEDNLSYLRIFHELGVRVIQVTYNTQNLIGAGCYETTDSGLTDFGREALAEMNEIGILADLSHVGPQTSHDVITHSTKPVVYSHVAPAALKPHPRTKSDEELRFIADHGGLAGACLLPAFMAAGNDATVEDYVDLIGHMVSTMGEDHVAIGTDFTQGHGKTFFEWLLRDKGYARVVTQQSLKELMEPVLPRGVSEIAELGNVTEAMLRRGWPEPRIRKILGENWLRIFDEVWEGSDDGRHRAH